jgi:ribosomal peptide maturation radical SAM protein 1
MPSSKPTIELVALPWSERYRPSAALAALAAYVRAERPAVAVRARHAFLQVANRLGHDRYDPIAERFDRGVGDALYAALLYPERRDQALPVFATAFDEEGAGSVEDSFAETLAILEQHLDELADELAASASIVGMTTCFSQLNGNLALAKRIKERAPHVTIVLGGSTLSDRIGASVIQAFPWIDFIVQGEGEQPLVAIVDHVLFAGDADIDDTRGVISRGNASARTGGAPLWEVPDLDALPYPDFDEYAADADALGESWLMPLEGSRGCWWDRTRRKNNPKATCYFCNLNVQWNGYREKSVARVADEMRFLAQRHKNLSAYFVDNIIRHKDTAAFADAIIELGMDFDIFYELRASISPYEVARMWEAGLSCVQFGIESLSTTYLRRIGKGTTLLQNLQAMKTCEELGIHNIANLIVDFPGATAAEVQETVDHILWYAMPYKPLKISPFALELGSTVELLPEQFGVEVQADRRSLRVLPDEIAQTIVPFDVSYRLAEPGVSWDPVRDAVATWKEKYDKRDVPLLYYRDGGTFLVILDDRFDDHREGVFEGLERELYLYCTTIRRRPHLAEAFPWASASEIDDALAKFEEFKLIAREDDRILSLAMAPTARAALARIRSQARETAPARTLTSVALPLAAATA